jgi:putative transposase
MISAEKARSPVSLQCELLGVSRSGYYEWLQRGPSDREIADELLTAKMVERLMRQAGISGMVTRKRGRTTIRVPGVRVADDLVRRGFRPDAPNTLWVADITYLSTWEGWLYLAAVQDAFSRSIVGWSMANHMRAELVTDALGMGLSRRQARDAGVAVSMGSKGDCYDNAVAESFFATLKKELVYHEAPWPTRKRADLGDLRVDRGVLQP